MELIVKSIAADYAPIPFRHESNPLSACVLKVAVADRALATTQMK
jgi:hypothetical protein